MKKIIRFFLSVFLFLGCVVAQASGQETKITGPIGSIEEITGEWLGVIPVSSKVIDSNPNKILLISSDGTAVNTGLYLLIESPSIIGITQRMVDPYRKIELISKNGIQQLKLERPKGALYLSVEKVTVAVIEGSRLGDLLVSWHQNSDGSGPVVRSQVFRKK